MVANILIAIGFFFTGLIAGMWLSVKVYQKAIDEWEKEDRRHLIMYEL